MEDGAILEPTENAAKCVMEVSRNDIALVTILNQHTEENNVQDLQKRVLLVIPITVLVRVKLLVIF